MDSRNTPHRFLPSIQCAAALAISPVCLLPGCATAPRSDLRCPDDPVAAKDMTKDPSFAPFRSPPRARVGSIPCPGPLTFYATADPNELGKHSYGSLPLVGPREGERGIVYTVHGGFIDIAHVRKAADWTAFHQPRIKHALEQGWQCIMLPSKEGADYRMRFNYPASWKAMEPARRQRTIDELSIRLAQRLAITQTAWHEIATWFGYSSTIYPEKPSALTYDDMTSHLLGAKAAGLALRNRTHDYNSAMTYHLKQELERLGVVSPEETRKALAMVENHWWRNGFVIKLQLDIGERTGVMQPWIVPGYPDGKTAAGLPFFIPSLKEVEGQDLSRMEQVEFDPNAAQWAHMRKIVPGNSDLCYPARDFPLLMDYIRNYEAGR